MIDMPLGEMYGREVSSISPTWCFFALPTYSEVKIWEIFFI